MAKRFRGTLARGATARQARRPAVSEALSFVECRGRVFDLAANLDGRGSGKVNDRDASRTSDAYLAIAPAAPLAKRCALAICIALFGAFCALVPLARVPVVRVDAFVPIYNSIVALNNLLTAGGLIVGFSRSRLRAVLVLAAGYLFSSLMALPHMMAFPVCFRHRVCSPAARRPASGSIFSGMEVFLSSRFVTSC